MGKRTVSALTALSINTEVALPAIRVAGFRLAVHVEYREDSPMSDTSNELEYVAVDINRNSDGKLIGEADFDLTL